MSDSLSSRVSRLISGSMNALVDAVEGSAPEIVMEEAIREVDQAITDVKQELGRAIAKEHLANSRLAEENKRHESLSDQVRIALDEGREDLAEAAVAKIVDIEAQVPILQETIAQAHEERTELERFAQALEGRRREMQDELRQFRESRTGTAGDGAGGGGTQASVDKAESAFSRVLERHAGIAARAGMTDPAGAKKLAELEELSRRKQIEDRLKRFKAGT